MSHIITDDAITIFHNRPYTASRAQIPAERWAQIMEALIKGELETAVSLLHVGRQLKQYCGSGRMRLEGGALYFDDKRLDSYAAQKAVQFMNADLPYEPLLRFIERLQANPSYRAVQALYQFLEAGRMPLTKDGHFLAYKKVIRAENDDLVDIYTKSIRNNIGDTPQMPRNQVDEDPEKTCSRGLHVCSYTYLSYYGAGPGTTIIVAKIDPADVVAVPKDYDNAKMRVCRYEVVDVLEELTEHVWQDRPLLEGYEDEKGEEGEVDEDENEGDGWIAWGGGESPLLDGTLVEFKHRDGYIGFDSNGYGPCQRKNWLWSNDIAPGDWIVAYRLPAQ